MIERRWLGAIAGMIGPALFMATFTVESWLRPGYRAREMFVSELSLGPRGWIQIANFIVTGVLLLLFAQRGRSVSRWKSMTSREWHR